MLSIITPVYNGERFIESCIRVIIAQNCPDVEHIIIDGGSSDKTVEIIKHYAQNYPHICWISEADKGQSDAMNKGIAMAKGEVISFLNVDDFYEPDVLNRILNYFKTLPEPSLLVGNCNIRNEADKIVSQQKPAKLQLQDLLLGFNINPPPVNPSAYFYHKSLHEKVGLYDIDEHYVMDNEFTLRAVQVANLQYVNEVWGNFRHIPGTKSYYYGKENHYFLNRYQQLLKKYVKDLPLPQRLPIYWEWYVNNRIKYFTSYPNELIPSMLKKVQGILNFSNR